MEDSSDAADEHPLPSLHDETRERDEYGVTESPVKNGAEGALRQAAASPDCEVELVGADEFEFLDGVTRLSTLEAELNDVRSGLMSRHGLTQYVPFRLFRPWADRTLSVTDLASGLWCEVQVEYRSLHPHLKTSREWRRMAEKGSPVVLKTESMKIGTAVHMKKELEVHEIVKVQTVTREDRAAVQLVNTYTQLSVVRSGAVEREIHVFGDLFELGVLVRGVIDQLQYSPETGELILTDYKTRRSKSLPSAEQKKGTSLQLMAYKYLLDRMCLGLTKPDLLYNHLNLDREAVLTQGAVDYIQRCGLASLFSGESDSDGIAGLKFGTLADRILQNVAGLGLPLVGPLMVQYEHQKSGETVGVESVDYEERWMRSEVEKALEFWAGVRPALGVDVENSGLKCGGCQFRDICVWRLRKRLETSPVAKLSSP
jgi:exonuclease V